MTMVIRLAAVLLLFTQLEQLALPAFCSPPHQSTAVCHETMPPDARQVALHPSSHQPPCAAVAMCGIPSTGIPNSAFTALAMDAAGRMAAPVITALQPGDRPAPLSPPPQA